MLRLLDHRKVREIDRDASIDETLEVSRRWLRETVEHLSIPRHFELQAENNRAIGRWLQRQLEGWGYQTEWQGECRNLVTMPRAVDRPVVLVGAHYDSVPDSPGADDNASAVAALLACARAIAEHEAAAHVMFVAFNREEDDLLGSREFVREYLPDRDFRIGEAHVLEMVGYADPKPGSQRVPRGLPIKIRDVGDFLGVLGNRISLGLVDEVLSTARSYDSQIPVMGLKIYFGLEKQIRHFLRSDHAPFWAARIPALMWTDTSEFRNPHYHQRSDLPSTLDYSFLQQVTRLLIAHVLRSAGSGS